MTLIFKLLTKCNKLYKMKLKNHRRIYFAAILTFCLLQSVMPQAVTPWLTSCDKSRLLQQQSSVSFGANAGTANVTLTLNPTTTYQTMDGFGFCMTEASAEVISSLSATQQSALLTELFDKTTGLGISVLRIGIGATDLSSSDYSYNETAGDVTMSKFSLAGLDLNYLIPILKKALAINPNIKILATPWSAPRWMKINTSSWIGSSLNTSYYAAYAKYFVKYFDAMKAQGINIWAITPQNEPENGSNEPSMLMTSTEQKNFINNNLGPEMAAAGYSGIKIIAYDHNCSNTTYPIDVCNNSTYVDGAAFHLYSGDISALTTVKNATGKNVYFTEQYTASTGSFSGDFAWHLLNVVIGSITNSAKAVIEWNVASNSAFGPRTNGGCVACQGAITVNSSTAYSRNVSYYIIGQLSKFVNAGAVRIGTTCTSGGYIQAAFKNPDGTLAALLYNSKTSSQVFKIVVGTQAFLYTIPASTAATFVWNPNVNALSDVRVNDLVLSPNPVKDIISVSNISNNISYHTLNIVSINGATMLTQTILPDEITTKINVSQLSSGIYILRLNGDSGSSYGRFIKN